MMREVAFELMQRALKDVLADLEADVRLAPTYKAYRLTVKRMHQIRTALQAAGEAS
jgi:hypothetical protein